MKKEAFSSRLNAALKKKGISQTKLAQKTGLDKSLINKYLSGVSEAGNDKIDILAKALNTNEVWLMGYDVSPKPFKNSDVALSFAQENEIIDNEYDDQIQKYAIDNDIELVIHKNKELTAESVIEVQKVLMDLKSKQEQQKNRSEKNIDSSETN